MRKLLLILNIIFISLDSSAQCPTIICPTNISVNNGIGTCGVVVNFTPPVGTNPCVNINNKTFIYAGSIQSFTIPAGVSKMTITTYGAQGGDVNSPVASGGLGAIMSGTFAATSGNVLNILVGGKAATGGYGAGGGGGTFVWDSTNNNTLLIASGGGGGACYGNGSGVNGANASTGINGTSGPANYGGGGIAGSGATIPSVNGYAGGGAGWLTNGANGGGTGCTIGYGGTTPLLGGAGGASSGGTTAGGYGGGGGGGGWCNLVGAGGGGGYSGGGAGGAVSSGGPFDGGGGGGSFNVGSNQIDSIGNTGDGKVIISWSVDAITTLVAGFSSGSTFPVGATTVTYSVADSAGNTSTCSFTVTVNDSINPTITAPANVNATTNSGCTATGVNLGTAIAADNCSVASIINDAPIAFPIGNTTVTWTVTDGNGNIATTTQTVTVTDTVNPTITAPANVTECNGTAIVLGTPTTADNCTVANVTNNAPVTFPVGTTTVVWTVTDGNGNTATASQTVTLEPAIDSTTSTSSITITAHQAGATYQWLNCTTGNSPITGATSQSYTATANGSYAVIVTLNGCSATSACVTINNMGVDEWADNNSVVIYPNPATSEIQITSNKFNITSVQIVNVLGEEVIKELIINNEKLTMDVSSLTKGVYFVRIEDVNRSIVNKKIIIE